MREQILDNWLNKVLNNAPYERKPLAGDASFRRYYRVFLKEETLIVMDAPPPESPELFCSTAALLEAQGLTVPKILAANFEVGFLLLSDLGDRLYLNELTVETAPRLYEDAMNALINLHACKTKTRVFNKAMMAEQLETLFKGWYLKTHLNFQSSAKLEAINDSLEYLLNSIVSQPRVLIHRDYHSRNLMVLDKNNPGILDFQDAVLGPCTYDLVSLLQDCYISWPRSLVEAWVFAFQKKLQTQKLLSENIKKEQFLKWFDFTGLQRHLKNLGIFARKYHRDQNPNYLKDLPMPEKYIFESLERYPELRELKFFFENTIKQGEKEV